MSIEDVKAYRGGISTDAGFCVAGPKPIDDRTVIKEKSGLDALVEAHIVFEGLEVYVVNEQRSYRYTNGQWISTDGIIKGVEITKLEYNNIGPELIVGEGYFLGDTYFVAVHHEDEDTYYAFPPSGLIVSNNGKKGCVQHDPTCWYITPLSIEEEQGFGAISLCKSSGNFVTVEYMRDYVETQILKGVW